jgi:hypothetical protein
MLGLRRNLTKILRQPLSPFLLTPIPRQHFSTNPSPKQQPPQTRKPYTPASPNPSNKKAQKLMLKVQNYSISTDNDLYSDIHAELNRIYSTQNLYLETAKKKQELLLGIDQPKYLKIYRDL